MLNVLRKVNVIFVGNIKSSFQRDLFYELKRLLGKVTLIHADPILQSPKRFIENIAKIIFLQKYYDVIFVEFLSFYAGILGFLRRIGIIKKPIVVRCHRTEIYDLYDKYKWLIKTAAKNAKLIICVSKRILGDLIKKISCAKGKSIVIYNGVDTSKFKPERKPFAGSEITLGTLGIHIARKGILELIFVVIRLIKKGHRIRLRIGSSGPLTLLFKKVVESKNVGDRIIFDGFVPEAELSSWYNSIDVFVLNSKSEGHPVAVLEAMSAGRVVIATEVDDLSEILGDRWTYKFGKWGDLIGLISLIEKMDRDKLERIANANRKKVLQRFDLKKQALKVAVAIAIISKRDQ